MKKFISVVMLMACLLSFSQSKAQYAIKMPLKAGDTVTNTGSATKSITITAGYSGVAIQPVLKKISGTVAGTIILSESLDGVNYINTDTLSNSNVATNTVIWKKAAPVPVYYKVTATGTGTMSAVLSVYYVPRKFD